MEKLQTNLYSVKIVGARHHLDDRLLTLWLSQALGSEIIISKQPIPADPMAVSARAWLDGQMRIVGYVAAENRELAHRLLLAMGKDSMTLRITRHREGHTTLLATAPEGLQPIPIKPFCFAPDWQSWVSPVKPLPLSDWMQEEDILAQHIIDTLPSAESVNALLRHKIKRYINLSAYDISLETRQQRNNIAHMLRSRKDAHDYGNELEQLYSLPGRVGTQTCGGEVCMRCISYLTDANNMRLLSRNNLPPKAAVEKALKDFPMDLYDVWLNQRNYFVARLYYACIPRHVLWSFISTLMYHELIAATPAGNLLLTSWANQATEMPDKVLSSLYFALTWLRDHGNDISPMATRTLMGEMQRRQEKNKELTVQENTPKQMPLMVSLKSDSTQMYLGASNDKLNK